MPKDPADVKLTFPPPKRNCVQGPANVRIWLKDSKGPAGSHDIEVLGAMYEIRGGLFCDTLIVYNSREEEMVPLANLARARAEATNAKA